MKSVGIDIGSTTTKVVILNEMNVIGTKVVETGTLPAEAAIEAYEALLREVGVDKDEISVVATTGYGRRLVDFGDIVMTEIKACVAGVLACDFDGERMRTVIDVGGQDTKVIAIGDDGEVEDFSMNDKCAAGTGRFLEMLARKLDMKYDEFVTAALRATNTIHMNATCAVFAESEVVGLLARHVSKEDLAGAAHDAIAARISSMIRRVGQRGPYCFVGGGAANAALVKSITENLGTNLYIPPQYKWVVALGAAIEGRRKYLKATRNSQS